MWRIMGVQRLFKILLFFPHLIMKSLLVLLALVAVVFSQTKIGNLPGYEGPELSQYAGYITIDEITGKNYFYWLVESEV